MLIDEEPDVDRLILFQNNEVIDSIFNVFRNK
jgi:hypothetical protein